MPDNPIASIEQGGIHVNSYWCRRLGPDALLIEMDCRAKRFDCDNFSCGLWLRKNSETLHHDGDDATTITAADGWRFELAESARYSVTILAMRTDADEGDTSLEWWDTQDATHA